jgi:hypothetical protein
MKKLLSLFGSIGLIASSSTTAMTVVSCGVTVKDPSTYLISGFSQDPTYLASDETAITPNSMYLSAWRSIDARFANGAIEKAIIDNNVNPYGFVGLTTNNIVSVLSQIPSITQQNIIDMVTGAKTYLGAAMTYASIDKSSVANLMNNAVFNNAVMINYYIMQCTATTENFDTSYGKEINTALETFSYTILDADGNVIFDNIKFVVRTDSKATGDPKMAILLTNPEKYQQKGDDGTMADVPVSAADHILVTYGDKTTTIYL